MREIQIKDKVSVYKRGNPTGYGYELMKKTFIELKPNGFERNIYECLFKTYNPELLKEVYAEIEKTKQIPETWPDTSKEILPMRIFIYKSKHHTYHYDAQTPEKLEKAMRKVLKEESEGYGYYPPDEPKNDSGIEKIEELEKIGIESLIKEVEQKFKKYEAEMKKYNASLSEWNLLQAVLEGKGTLRNIFDVFREYEPDRWEVVDLDSAD